MSATVGVYGLGVMGRNVALNFATHGLEVSVSNLHPEFIKAVLDEAQSHELKNINGYEDIASFIDSIAQPRKVIILVPAGQAVDDSIEKFLPHLKAGDIIIDGGNEHYEVSIRRAKSLSTHNIRFVGLGISGGEEGARHGASLMPGCDIDVYSEVEPLLQILAAKHDNGELATSHLGPVGSGNYVKMIHNGIEYGIMECISEIYGCFRDALKISNLEMSKIFAKWNDDPKLSGYLMAITSHIVITPDSTTQGYLLNKVLDVAGSKGTGQWTVLEAFQRGIAVPTITASLEMRYMTSRPNERAQAQKKILGPQEIPRLKHEQVYQDCHDALHITFLCCFAQGLLLLQKASHDMGWNISCIRCLKLWKSGCIIRSSLLDDIIKAFERHLNINNDDKDSDDEDESRDNTAKSPSNTSATGNTSEDMFQLLLDPVIVGHLRQTNALRRIVTLCIASGVPCPALTASLTYIDTLRNTSLATNVIQAQRDCFGSHGYERTDKTGRFHSQWLADR